MDLLNFEKIDAIYISKLILDELDLEYEKKNEDNLLASKSESLSAAIRDIEKMENEWGISISDKKHTFGRKELNEIIKLWSVPQKSAEVLENLVILTGAKNILEIGASAGYSTLHLASGAKFNFGKVYTVELLKEKIDLARVNFQKSGLDNIILLEGEASKILENWNYEEIDFVFLDADKENYGKYLDLLLPKMKLGSLIVADNINDYGHMMEDYLQRVTGTHLPKSRVDHRVSSYYLAALDNGLMITKKIEN
jgi:predicted O-methyltransferase YrrM